MRAMQYPSERDPSDSGYPVRRRGRFKILPIILFALFALYYITSNTQTVPMTGRKQIVDMSREDEMALGLQSYAQVLQQANVIAGGPELETVRSVGARIAKATDNSDFEWEFNLLQSPDVNAFCLPGGKVAVYTGILPVAENEDGIAVILGHEIAHAIARHGAERMAQERLAQIGQLAVGVAASDMDDGARRAVLGAFGAGAQFGVLLPFSREHESEADYMGLMFMARACFNPREAPAFWQRMASRAGSGRTAEFLSTHPSSERRIEQLEQWMDAAMQERAKYCS